MVSGHLLHYERLLWGCSPSSEAFRSEEAWGDPLRPNMQECTAALNKVMEAHGRDRREHQREHQRLRIRQLTRQQATQRPTGGEPDAGLEARQLEEAVSPPGAPPQPEAPGA